MVAANINRKSAQSQGNAWQDTLRDYKAQMMTDKQQQIAPETDKNTSAHKMKPGNGKTPPKFANEPQAEKELQKHDQKYLATQNR
ncbi:hypothetical protein DOE63_20760 [Salmonella enterica subsp. diarizonae serovar 59:z10:-]|nr:hypothetical protein DOE63_20760 [Salmonella enterica subsp. diarizonae serovar 59:z10:-]